MGIRIWLGILHPCSQPRKKYVSRLMEPLTIRKTERSDLQKAVPEKARAAKQINDDVRKEARAKANAERRYDRALALVQSMTPALAPAPEVVETEPPVVVQKTKKVKVAPAPVADLSEESDSEDVIEKAKPAKKQYKPVVNTQARQIVFC